MVSICFFGQEGSGIVRIQTNGKAEEEIDLYSADAEWKRIEWNNSGRKVVEIRAVTYVALLFAWGCAFFLLMNCVGGKPHCRKLFECTLVICSLSTLAVLVKEYGCIWETNDDATIAYLLSRPNNDYCPFIGQVLSVGLQKAYLVRFNVDWWLIVQLVCAFVGTFEILYVLCRQVSPLVELTIALGVLVLVWHIALEEINFTRTSILISIGGTAFIADAVLIRGKAGVKKTLEYLIGCVSLFAGQQIRSSGVWVALAGLAAVGMAVILMEIQAFTWVEIRKWIDRGLLLWLAVGIALLGISVDRILTTPEQAEYNAYNERRSEIEDYALRYTDYQETGDNLSKEDLKTFLLWYSEDPSVFTDEKLDNTIQSGHPISGKYFIKNLKNTCGKNGLLLGVVVLCALLLLLQQRPRKLRYWIADFAPLLIGILLSVYLIYSGRLPQRVFQPVCFMIIVGYVILWERECDISEDNMSLTVNKKTFCSILFAGVLLFYACASFPDIAQRQAHRNADQKAKDEDKKIFDEINLDCENVYFIPIQMDIHAPAEMTEIWQTVPANYCDNVFFLGGWTAKMPYKLRLLSERGILNPTRALLEDDFVFTIATEEVTDFLRRNYGGHVTISGVKEIENVMFVCYTMPIPDEEIGQKRVGVRGLEIHEETYDGTVGWRVRGKTELVGNETFYCNITLAEGRYTYRIKTDESGNFSTLFYDIPDTSDIRCAEPVFYKK